VRANGTRRTGERQGTKKDFRRRMVAVEGAGEAKVPEACRGKLRCPSRRKVRECQNGWKRGETFWRSLEGGPSVSASRRKNHGQNKHLKRFKLVRGICAMKYGLPIILPTQNVKWMLWDPGLSLLAGKKQRKKRPNGCFGHVGIVGGFQSLRAPTKMLQGIENCADCVFEPRRWPGDVQDSESAIGRFVLA